MRPSVALSRRAARCLKRVGITTPMELASRCACCVAEIPGIGRRTFGEIECWMMVNGFAFISERECACTASCPCPVEINEDKYAASIWEAIATSKDSQPYNELDIEVRYALRRAANRVVGLLLQDLASDFSE